MIKIASGFSIAAVLVSLGLTSATVFAENTNDGIVIQNSVKISEGSRENDKQKIEIKGESDIHTQESVREDKKTRDEMDQEENDQNETSLHEHLASVPDAKTVVTVPVVDATKINTYADVVISLNQYKDAVNQINSTSNVADVASSTLSAAEKAILVKLTIKNSFELSRTSVRANEVVNQINDLITVLTPLGTQTISTELNLKNLLVAQLYDFSSTINSLTTLADTSSSIIDEETN